MSAVLLGLLSVLVLLGTLFPQQPGYDELRWNTAIQNRYGGLAGPLAAIGLFNLYHSLGFRLNLIALTLNLAACTLRRGPALWRAAFARRPVVRPHSFYQSGPHRASFTLAENITDPMNLLTSVLRRRGFRLHAATQEGTYLLAERGRWTPLASLLSHVAALALVLAFGASELWASHCTVVLLPGQTIPLVGEALLRHDGFDIQRDEAGRAVQYIAHLTVLENQREVRRAEVRVNAPLHHRIGIYLYGYGPALLVTAHLADGTPVRLQAPEGISQTGQIALISGGEGAGTELFLPDQNLTLHLVYHSQGPRLFLQAFRPGETRPILAEEVQPNTPVDIAQSGVTLSIGVDRYLELQLVHDPGYPWAVSAGAVLLAGLIVSLYLPQRRVWARVRGGEAWLVGQSDRDAAGFAAQFAELVQELETKLGPLTPPKETAG